MQLSDGTSQGSQSGDTAPDRAGPALGGARGGRLLLYCRGRRFQCVWETPCKHNVKQTQGEKRGQIMARREEAETQSHQREKNC